MRFAIGRRATREGGGAMICGGGKRRLVNSRGRLYDIIWRRQGQGNSNPVGIERAGNGRRYQNLNKDGGVV